MYIKKAAFSMRSLVAKSSLPDWHSEYGKDHMFYMIDSITKGYVIKEKAHRWLGYIQGCVVCYGGATLEDVKHINYKA